MKRRGEYPLENDAMKTERKKSGRGAFAKNKAAKNPNTPPSAETDRDRMGIQVSGRTAVVEKMPEQGCISPEITINITRTRKKVWTQGLPIERA